MKNLVKYSLVTSLLLGGAACTDLDEKIKGDFVKEAPVQNFGVGLKEGGVDDGLTGAFNRVLNGTANHNSYFSVQEVSSDEAVITQKGGDWFDGGIWLNMHKHAFSSAVGGINGAWNDTYTGIFQCNELLAKPQTPANIAQLRTLRAYFYWRLLDVFGNVKLALSTADVPQSTRPAVYAFVESELLAALPDLSGGKQAYGRFNKSGANALLARLYLNANIYKGTVPDNADYDKAIAAADAVINSGIYTISGVKYKDVFAPNNIENPEHIFVAPFDQASGQGMNLAQMTLHYPSQLTYRLAEQPWNGYSTLEDFYNSYEAVDERKTNNFIVGPQTDRAGSPILDLAFDKGDEDGAGVNYTPKINMLAPNGSRQAGARLGKFSFKIGQFQNMDNDYPLLRYGEVLLNKAEALARKNGYGDATALALVNQIRTRAGVPAFTNLTAGALLAERGRELFIEGLRRTDLIRFGAWGNAWWEKPAHSDAFKNLMPIPLEQINATSGLGANKLTQNPGYQ